MNYFKFNYKKNFFNITSNIGSPEYYLIKSDFLFQFQILFESLQCDSNYIQSIGQSLFNCMLSNKVYYHTPVHIMSIFDFIDGRNMTVENDMQLAIFFHDAIY